MKVSKRESRIISQALEQWRTETLISQQQHDDLQQSLEVSYIDWPQVAKYSFWIAIACIVFALLSFMLDGWIVNLMQRLFSAPDTAKSVLFAISAALFCLCGLYRKKQSPNRLFSNEAFFVVAVLNAGIAIFYLGQVIETDNLANLVLFASVIYALLALWLPSAMVWVCTLITLGFWFGLQTHHSATDGYFLAMNFPLRFTLFGAVMTLLAHVYKTHNADRNEFGFIAKVAGLSYLFVSLWLVSIFGNYVNFSGWSQVSQLEFIGWALLLGALSIYALYYGIRYDDEVSKAFGLVFILINLYSRFFEYFWQDTHKALFFAILGLSFWFVGSKAESLYNLNRNGSKSSQVRSPQDRSPQDK
ncbi:hypothetical protein [Vibrio hippocampi]|uniref:DUF2157 domain-containing protein n=1 Tax=Vibrio hippocampi TaxID=654686 RepID=A0ABM8ZHC5_9VIBR|nr:hypothetical protein [Vibrio hippocampi]CAH0525672.1 hypothetical protein VHP8226_01202 [Vibrio hippocampi]